jgi:hypothetical protein
VTRHQTPFDSIESAYEYVRLLGLQIDEVRTGLAEEIAVAEQHGSSRRLDAFRLVDYKLIQLASHMEASRRILNDLKALRRLLLGQREGRIDVVHSDETPTEI